MWDQARERISRLHPNKSRFNEMTIDMFFAWKDKEAAKKTA